MFHICDPPWDANRKNDEGARFYTQVFREKVDSLRSEASTTGKYGLSLYDNSPEGSEVSSPTNILFKGLPVVGKTLLCRFSAPLARVDAEPPLQFAILILLTSATLLFGQNRVVLMFFRTTLIYDSKVSSPSATP